MSVRKRKIKLTHGLKLTKNWRYKFIILSKITEGSPNLSIYHLPYRTVPYRNLPSSTRDHFGRPRSIPYFFDRFPYRTVPYRTVPYRTVPYRTVPYRTVPYRTVPYRTVPYRTVPYLVFHERPFWSTAQHTVLFPF
jgi:hypothetical protein